MSEEHGSHEHGIYPDADRPYLAPALGLIVGFMAVEVIVSFLSHSLALVADAGHMLVDAGVIGGSIWALNLARRTDLTPDAIR